MKQPRDLENTGGLWIYDEEGHARRLLDIVKMKYPDAWAEIEKEDAEKEAEEDTEG